MRVRTLIGTGALLLAMPLNVMAQASSQFVDPVDGLTLDQAIAQALVREPSLRAARAEIDAARGIERQAGVRPNPSVSLEWRDEPGGTDNQAMTSVEWPLDLFRRSARVTAAQRERAVTELAVADRERRIAADVRQKYGELLVELRELGVLEELVASVETQHRLLDARVQEGASPSLDRDLVDVEVRRWQADRLLQQGRTDASLVRLKRALGLRPGDPLKIRESLDGIVEREGVWSEEEVATVERRTDVLGAAARVRAADAKVERAKSESRFDVTLFGGYSRMDVGFPQRGLSPEGELTRVRGIFNYVSAGAMIAVPLFNRNQGEIAAAAAERTAAAARYESAALDAAAEVAAARAVDDRAREGVSIFTRGARAAALRNLDVVRQSYALGRATVFDVLAEGRRFLDFERAYTAALRSAYDARTALLEAQGGVR